jgi:transposase
MDKHEAVVAALHAGKTIREIVKAVGVSQATVYDVKKYLCERGSVRRKPGSGKPPTIVT